MKQATAHSKTPRVKENTPRSLILRAIKSVKNLVRGKLVYKAGTTSSNN